MYSCIYIYRFYFVSGGWLRASPKTLLVRRSRSTKKYFSITTYGLDKTPSLQHSDVSASYKRLFRLFHFPGWVSFVLSLLAQHTNCVLCIEHKITKARDTYLRKVTNFLFMRQSKQHFVRNNKEKMAHKFCLSSFNIWIFIIFGD